MTMRYRGFTLTELMIGLVLIAVLMTLALPTYTQFMGNTRIRNTTDSLAGGMRQAQVEAVRRNRNIEFIVTPGTGWRIRDPSDNSILQNEPFAESAGQILVDPNPPGAVKITWSSLGQFLTPTNPDDGTPVFQSIRVTNTAIASPHDLRVTADPALGVGVRVCDKRFAATDPSGCPAGVP
jgi:type IV fimbrial biogenesis protein FimT